MNSQAHDRGKLIVFFPTEHLLVFTA
jgi:hypothetical protein